MIISVYSTMVLSTPPAGYGGLENISYVLARYLDETNNTVYLFATQESYQPKNGQLFSAGPAGKVNPDEAIKSFWNDERSKKALMESDICIDFSWDYYLYAFHDKLKHLCKSWHGPTIGIMNPNNLPVKHPNLIAVGFNHAKHLTQQAPNLTWRAIQNGIELDKYKFNPKPISERERLLWISRLYPPKAAHRAIEIANRLQMPIDIVGGSFGDIHQYIDNIKNMCEQSQYATFHGEVSFEKKLEFYYNAKAVLLPIIEVGSIVDQSGKPFPWFEPFGLITPECNAAGTPIVVSPNGGFQESMIHGFNGYFANSDSEFEYYIKKVDELKPENCRMMAEKFDYKIMGKNYLDLFNKIVYEGEQW